jgi:acetylornithine deacetylase
MTAVTSSGDNRQAVARLEARATELVDESTLVQLTRRLIRQQGQNPPGDEAATAAELGNICAEHSLRVHTSAAAPGRDNVHACTTGGSGPGLLLLGHTDVVPVGDGWSVDPFDGVLRDRLIYGRGATDMKGGLASCVVAMSALQRAATDTGVALTGPVELAATVDEEEGGLGIRQLVRSPHPRYLGCITTEPTDLQTVIAVRGDCYFDITVHGKAAHAGRPSDGCNAIYGAARVIESLRRWHDELAGETHPLAGAATWSVGQIDGGHGTAIVPARCRVQADRRLLPGEDVAAVLAAVRARLDGLGLADDGLSVEVSMPMSMPGFDTAADHPFPITVDRALCDSAGPGLPLAGWTAACDGGYIARDLAVPTVVLGPGSVTEQAHRPDECVPVRDLVVAARTYARVAARLLGAESGHSNTAAPPE